MQIAAAKVIKARQGCRRGAGDVENGLVALRVVADDRNRAGVGERGRRHQAFGAENAVADVQCAVVGSGLACIGQSSVDRQAAAAVGIAAVIGIGVDVDRAGVRQPARERQRRGGILQLEVAGVARQTGESRIVRQIVGVGDEAGRIGQIKLSPRRNRGDFARAEFEQRIAAVRIAAAKVIRAHNVVGAAPVISRTASLPLAISPTIEIEPVLTSEAALTKASAPKIELPMASVSSLVSAPSMTRLLPPLGSRP